MTNKEQLMAANFVIPTLEWVQRAEEVLKRIEGKETIPSHHVAELFVLHNDRIKPQEHGRHCGGCVLRVIGRVRTELQTINDSN